MSTDLEIVVAFTTVATEKQAESLAKTLVTTALAACVQIDGPIRSFYLWPSESGENQQEESSEFRLSIKATKAQIDKIEQKLAELHPYEVPQWVVIQAQASHGYGDWIRNSKNPE
ncbi:MAG: divalent-cation tolerance protein CutA [Planctomycetota bacterium]